MHSLKKILSNIVLSVILAICNLFILLFPKEILETSRYAITMWATNILPSILPFMIITNILLKIGFIEIAGIFFEDIMYPIFKVPGCGAFAFTSGIVSGYPLGAKIISSLYKSRQISDIHAQRLISFCNNAGPLFIIGTIGTVMLENKYAGYFIMSIHYISAIITGIIFKFYKQRNDKYFGVAKSNLSKSKLFVRIIKKNSASNTKNIFSVITNSINESIQSILRIGGFVLMFSIIAKIFELSKVVIIMWNLISSLPFINLLGYKNFYGLLTGILEVTSGAKIIATKNFSSTTLIMLSALISFGGFCVHFQSINYILAAKINIALYLLAKLMQSLIAVLLSHIMLNVFHSFDTYLFNESAIAVFNPSTNFVNRINFSFKIILFMLCAKIILILSIALLKTINRVRVRR